MTIPNTCALLLTFYPSIALEGPILRLGDVVDLSALPARVVARVGRTPLLRVDPRLTRTTVPRRTLADHIGARIPALAACSGLAGPDIVIRRPVAAGTPRAAGSTPEAIALGDRIALRIKSGAFAIERSGVATSKARAGEWLFVRVASAEVVRAIAAEPRR